MSDKKEAMDNLIAQDADLIEICPDDLAQRLFIEADNFKVDREVGMRAMLYRAADCIEAQAAEIKWLRVETKAQFDRGYYDGCTHLLQPIQSAMADEIKQLRKEQEQSK
jgi:hypothetical protein